MIKVVLLLLLFNTHTGQVTGVYQTSAENTPPGFPSVSDCEQASADYIAANPAPEGFSQRGYCITPSVAQAGTKL